MGIFSDPGDRDRSQSPPCCQRLILQGRTNIAIYDPHLYGVGHGLLYKPIRFTKQQTQDYEPMSRQVWASVVDGGSTLRRHWLIALCLLATITDDHQAKTEGRASAGVTLGQSRGRCANIKTTYALFDCLSFEVLASFFRGAHSEVASFFLYQI